MPLTKEKVTQARGCWEKKSTKINISRCYHAISVVTGEVQDAESQPPISLCRRLRHRDFIVRAVQSHRTVLSRAMPQMGVLEHQFGCSGKNILEREQNESEENRMQVQESK